MLNNDSIFALATPNGYGALSIIRISGENCFEKLSKIFRFASKNMNMNKIESHKIYFGHIIHNDKVIDEALLSIFKSPKSYTKEDSAEISLHGSPYIAEKIAIALLESGMRQASPGEFTMRAFMNGRFDLSQAEAVADIISSHSDASHNLAFKQFRGDFSKQIENLRQELLKFASLIELELDFAEEDVEFADRQKLDELVNLIISEISSLRKSFNQGNVIKQGIPVAISGRPNAGKSTLLNLLLHDERALVSNIPGTTRDALEEIISINGISFRFIDTAGLRQTDDEIEKMGINKTMQMLNKADVILYIADIPEVTTDDILSDIDELRKGIVNFEKKKLIIVGNKIDLMLEIPHGFNKLLASDMVFISAKRKENIELLEDKLLKIVQENKYEDGFVVSNTRHYEALMHTEDALKRVNQGLKNNISQDLLTSDIRDALFYLGTITGKITNDDILDSIFKNFCVGK